MGFRTPKIKIKLGKNSQCRASSGRRLPARLDAPSTRLQVWENEGVVRASPRRALDAPARIACRGDAQPTHPRRAIN